MNNKIRTLTAAIFSTALLFSVSGASFAADDTMKTGAASETDSAQPGTDTWITTKVKADLLATENVDGTKINVTTVNGVVTLAGVLDDQAQVDRAIALTKAIEGVTGVETKALKTR
ncbi:BON domain-containing protein [Chiayiivirga flava]|uniref:Hyperosmotically inducible protein n=1 Tax=Chiayiivirga flava TaxID=659595 RepID=A0A7W8D5S3_9GAMM|nr:BON domain-containing protein [Chiayiivirga flava]MBB5206763.1 hyperosmotically inducible protein [Chiayiivirga flava]